MKTTKKQKNLQYPIKGFRLAETTIKALDSLKRKTDKSYNLLMLDMIANYQRYKKFKKPEYHQDKQKEQDMINN